MPNYKGHLVGGIVTYLLMLQLIKHYGPGVHVVMQGAIFCLLGSLFPDVDVKSKGQKIFYSLLFLFLLYCLHLQRWDLFAILSLLGIIPLLVKHRGLFHQVWFLLLLTLGVVVSTKVSYKAHTSLFWANGAFFFAGCLSHVFLDRLVSKWKRHR